MGILDVQSEENRLADYIRHHALFRATVEHAISAGFIYGIPARSNADGRKLLSDVLSDLNRYGIIDRSGLVDIATSEEIKTHNSTI